MKTRKSLWIVCTMTILMIAVSFIPIYAAPEFDPICDVNFDGKIDIFDVTKVSSLYGASGDPANLRVVGPSYIIYRDGSTYYRKNGTTGVIVNNTNASKLVNNAIGNLSMYGGRIYFKSGDYDFDAPIIINKAGVHIDGEGRWASRLRVKSNSNIEYLVKIYSVSNQSYTDNVLIRNVCFFNPSWETRNITGAIYINNKREIVWDVTIENVLFWRVDAIYTDPSYTEYKVLQHSTFKDLVITFPVKSAINLTHVIDITLDNIWIYFSSWKVQTHGIYLRSIQSSGVTMQNIRVFSADFGIRLIQSDDTRIINSIVDFASVGVEINNSSRVSITNVYSHAPNGLGYGFLIGPWQNTSNNTVIMNSQARNCKVGFKDETPSGYIHAFIGNSAVDSTTKWSIKSSSITRGNFDYPDGP